MHSIPPFPSQWLEVLAPWGGNTALDAVLPGLLADSARDVIYPQPQDLWRALELCPPDAVKVVQENAPRLVDVVTANVDWNATAPDAVSVVQSMASFPDSVKATVDPDTFA